MTKPKYYQVTAMQPQAGIGSSMDTRVIGPFAERRTAEQAAVALAQDPRAYARITIDEIEG